MTALRERRFRRLWIGQTLSSFGDSALYLSLAIWVKDLTGSNRAAGAVFLALGSASLLAPLGGYVVDRARHRRRLLMVTDAATAALVCTLLLVHSRDQLWLIYAVAFGYGLSGTVFGPATSALLKDLLDERELGSSNALRQISGQGVRLLSPVVGAALYAGIGGGALAGFDALTFVASIVAVASVRVDESEPATDRTAFRREIRAGFAHVAGHPVLRRLSISSALVMLVLGLYESIEFAVLAALGRPPSFFGVLMSVQAGGSIAAGLAVTTLLRRLSEPRVVALGALCFAVGSALLTSADLVLVCVGLVIIGAAISLFFVGLYTALQRLTPPRLQGRVSAASYVLTDVPQTLSIASGVALIAVVDYRLLLAAIVAVTSLCSLALVRAPSTETSATERLPEHSSA